MKQTKHIRHLLHSGTAFSILKRIELGETLGLTGAAAGAATAFSILKRIELGETIAGVMQKMPWE